MATVGAVAMTAALSSCTKAGPHATASPSVSQGNGRAYAAAIAEVNEYLTVWREHGLVAAQRFKVLSERGPDPSPVKLNGGEVTSYRPYRWVSEDNFTLLVILNLRFSGSPGAWNPGKNGRFITFTRKAGQSRYLMYFATGP
jgi:hypothetical protein